MNFNELRKGDSARILGFGNMPDSYRNRLMSLGVTPGAEFTLNHLSPLGDPVAIMIRGFRLSLRREEAADLLVEKL